MVVVLRPLLLAAEAASHCPMLSAALTAAASAAATAAAAAASLPPLLRGLGWAGWSLRILALLL